MWTAKALYGPARSVRSDLSALIKGILARSAEIKEIAGSRRSLGITFARYTGDPIQAEGIMAQVRVL